MAIDQADLRDWARNTSHSAYCHGSGKSAHICYGCRVLALIAEVETASQEIPGAAKVIRGLKNHVHVIEGARLRKGGMIINIHTTEDVLRWLDAFAVDAEIRAEEEAER